MQVLGFLNCASNGMYSCHVSINLVGGQLTEAVAVLEENDSRMLGWFLLFAGNSRVCWMFD